MRKTILALAGSAALSMLALTGMLATAQAHEYSHHVIRYHHDLHGHKFFRWFSHVLHGRRV